MSVNKSVTNKRRPPKRKGGAAFYVYCVGERDALAPLLADRAPSAIEDGARLEMVDRDGLTAVASTVSLSDYGEEALQARLTDPAWTALRVMRHEKVVEYLAARASIVPVRFGAIYLERARIEEMISARRAELSVIIERLRGCEEWGINIYCDRAQLNKTIPDLSPRLRELTERAAAAPPGQSYLMRKKIEALRADEARGEVKRAAANIESELASTSEGATRLQRIVKMDTAAAGVEGEVTRGELIAKLAFLVARTRFGEFHAAAERLAARYAAPGFRLELTGPWPAYNFAAPPAAAT